MPASSMILTPSRGPLIEGSFARQTPGHRGVSQVDARKPGWAPLAGKAGRVTGRQAFAPGRVNLIGDHTDYNGGLALPMAIELGTTVGFTPAGDAGVRIVSDHATSSAFVPRDLSDDPGVVETFEPSWAAMSAGVLVQCEPRPTGELVITSTLPIGAGLSSSASCCVAVALAVGIDQPPGVLARLCQRAEALSGSNVGLLDQTVILNARRGHALLIDFATMALEPVALSDAAEITVIHSGVERILVDSPYARRRVECAEAARRLGHPLGLASIAQCAGLGDSVLQRRTRHVVTECERVRQFSSAMARQDMAEAGRLLTESHRSLARDFECSTTQVDQLVGLLVATPGVHGARITGGGFGGCVVVLAEPGALDLTGFERHWRVNAGEGARILDATPS